MDLFKRPLDLTHHSYSEVKELCESCTRCGLSKTRHSVVVGSGPVPCSLMLIGEAPGETVDLQGLPFVGKAGQLLTKIFEAVQIHRDTDVYITNIVKCRPPENRVPQSDEVDACAPYLEAQIQLVQPRILLLAGSPSVKTILKNDTPITKIRGQWFRYSSTIMAMPLFHPAYLLRNQSRAIGSPKWLTWQDMKEVRGALDLLAEAGEIPKLGHSAPKEEADVHSA